MKFLVDVGVGRRVESYLESSGHDVRGVRTIDPKMSDTDILTMASTERRLVITMDKDFGDLVYRAAQRHAGVLLLRMEDADGETKRSVVEAIITNHLNEIAGRFAVYQRGRLRVRKA